MKLLHLEDNDHDAELFRELLMHEWPDCEITRLSTREEFQTAIESGPFDLILSDHSMPGFDGLTALQTARATCPATPFVFLSGTIGETRAIEALKHGAVDYVLKDAPARFLSAVRGALAHAQHQAAKRHAEDSLRQSQEQFQQIAENIDDFVVLIDAQGHCLYANPTFRQLIHRTDLSLRLNILEDIHPDDRKRFREFLVNATRPGAARDIEYRILLAGETVRHMEARISLLRYSSDEAPILLLAGRNVTERRKAEELLRERASLLEKAQDAICVFNLRFAITLWNASAERTFGWAAADALGQSFRDLLFAGDHSQFDTVFALTLAQGEWQGEFHLTRPDGRSLTVDSSWTLVSDDSGQTKSILCINTDVTARKQLEQELQRTQRMESIGMLAGGIAHDLNNMLSPILLSVGLLRPLAQDSESKTILETLETSATNGSELVRQILLFARGGEGERTAVNMGEFLSGLRGFLKSALRRGIELYTDYQPDVWPISADATQLKQVLLNLCVNARDAMPKGGSVRITARNLSLPPVGQKPAHGTMPKGPCVRLSVADTGTGIPPQILDRIFDPFFTTKELGKGTGLGLSTILGIVRGHDGAILVESSAADGTTFHIYFPACLKPQPPVVQRPPQALPRGSGELIIVIDDDDGIRLVTERILTSQGYEVVTAHDGESGLELYHRERARVQLVICDQMMPGLSGAAVLSQIHREDPGVKLIAMSGLSESPVFPGSDARITFLPKPVATDTLLHTVRRTLDAGHPVATSRN